MRVVTAGEIDRRLTYPTLVDALRAGVPRRRHVPLRHHHTIGAAPAPTRRCC